MASGTSRASLPGVTADPDPFVRGDGATGGAERLLRAMVRRGLAPSALKAAAPLALALDRPPLVPTGITMRQKGADD